jgi:replication-associated recombination protein RarA
MKLSAKYQPTTLDEVVGQSGPIRRLKAFVQYPESRCVLLEGPGGTGKSAAAKALVHDMGVCPYSGLIEYSAANLKIDEVRHLFGHHVDGRDRSNALRMRPMSGSPWHVLLIEELELLPSENVVPLLKDELSEQHLPPRLIVVATSNDASGLDEALLQRFDIYPFSSGPSFADACLDRLNWIWQVEVGMDVPLPSHVAGMGWRNNTYSMRRALAALGAAIEIYFATNAERKVAE